MAPSQSLAGRSSIDVYQWLGKLLIQVDIPPYHAGGSGTIDIPIDGQRLLEKTSGYCNAIGDPTTVKAWYQRTYVVFLCTWTVAPFTCRGRGRGRDKGRGRDRDEAKAKATTQNIKSHQKSRQKNKISWQKKLK